MEKTIARIVSILFHPLFMTTIGLLIIFNSGTYLSVLSPQVKKVSMIATILFTVIFPASAIMILYLSKTIYDIELNERKERSIPFIISIVLYLFTFFLMREIRQLSAGHLVYFFCPPLIIFFLLILNNWSKPSVHMAAIGMLSGVLLMLIVLFNASLQGAFILSMIAAGLTGTARLILGKHFPLEILTGYLTGFLVAAVVIFFYAV